ncbi:hypothetical protein BHE74_00003507 [Ensete ventricosum]|nr:hypothetical protein GW17_00006014 [Ensete ventricosum]RWW87644.1 hypothetical protein BHE74_00003507 [Ensete ventricosum]RZR77272.1 hypothetical protein BHM03_00002287 [Ensete ventricosum]
MEVRDIKKLLSNRSRATAVPKDKTLNLFQTLWQSLAALHFHVLVSEFEPRFGTHKYGVLSGGSASTSNQMVKGAESCVPLSKVATSNTHGEDSPYFAGWKAYDEDPYDAANNPAGVIQMGLAENQVSFDRDLRWRTGVRIIPVHCSSSNGFQVTLQALEDAYVKAEGMKIRVRGLLLTNPSNPLGTTITGHVLEEVLDFVTQKDIHLISDEIYSGSVFSSDEFVSVAEIVEARGYKDCDRVHIVYSLSKDLGLPGFRVGAIYSYNDRVVTTARRMSSFTLVSSQTQKMLAAMLTDREFTENYLKTNRERLKKRHDFITEGLKNAGIECLPGNAGLFCWMNLAPLLEEPTKEGELKLWSLIVREAKLNISPGSSCHCSEAGWFRVCFANMSQQTLEVALRRIKDFMKNVKAKQDK